MVIYAINVSITKQANTPHKLSALTNPIKTIINKNINTIKIFIPSIITSYS